MQRRLGYNKKKYSKKERKKLLPSGPSQKWTSRAATFAEQSVGSSSKVA